RRAGSTGCRMGKAAGPVESGPSVLRVVRVPNEYAARTKKTAWVRRLRGRMSNGRATGDDGDFEGKSETSSYYRPRPGGLETAASRSGYAVIGASEAGHGVTGPKGEVS